MSGIPGFSRSNRPPHLLFSRYGVRMASGAAYFSGPASLENYQQNRFQYHPIKEHYDEKKITRSKPCL